MRGRRSRLSTHFRRLIPESHRGSAVLPERGGPISRAAFFRAAPGRAISSSTFRPCYTDTPLPLVVMLHGCTQNPDDFATGTRVNRWAEEQALPGRLPRTDSTRQLSPVLELVSPGRSAGRPWRARDHCRHRESRSSTSIRSTPGASTLPACRQAARWPPSWRASTPSCLPQSASIRGCRLEPRTMWPPRLPLMKSGQPSFCVSVGAESAAARGAADRACMATPIAPSIPPTATGWFRTPSKHTGC